MTSHQARYYAATIKQSVAHVFATSPETFAHEAMRRMLWEVGDVMADVQGARRAASSLYAVADAIALREGVDAVWPPKGAEVAPQVASHISDPIVSAIREKIEAMGGTMEVISVETTEPEPEPAWEVPTSRLRAFAEDFCSSNWLGIAFLAFWTGLALGGMPG